MSETDTIQYYPIREYNFKEYFQKFQYNGKVISDAEREDFIKLLDDTIAQYSGGFPMLKEGLDNCNNSEGDFFKAYRTDLSVALFVLMTFIDCLVICKYFLLADTDYDKRFMRGKMKVILNEGFKKLYGFEKKTNEKSEWNKLSEIVEHLPMTFQFEYRKLTYLLDNHSKSSSWWKDERDVETHLDIEKLYESRCEEIEESKVMMDSVKLFSTLLAVQLFLTKVHGCFLNTIIQNCKNQEASKA